MIILGFFLILKGESKMKQIINEEPVDGIVYINEITDSKFRYVAAINKLHIVRFLLTYVDGKFRWLNLDSMNITTHRFLHVKDALKHMFKLNYELFHFNRDEIVMRVIINEE
jgi:hypothetical protein